MQRYCANLKAIRYESTSLNRIAADKSHSVIVALNSLLMTQDSNIPGKYLACRRFYIIKEKDPFMTV